MGFLEKHDQVLTQKVKQLEMDINTQTHTFLYLTQAHLPKYRINLEPQSVDTHVLYTPKHTHAHPEVHASLFTSLTQIQTSALVNVPPTGKHTLNCGWLI